MLPWYQEKPFAKMMIMIWDFNKTNNRQIENININTNYKLQTNYKIDNKH